MDNRSNYNLSQRRLFLDKQLTNLSANSFIASFSYAISTVIFFAVAPLFYFEILFIALCSYAFCLFLIKQTPKMIILRSFENNTVDAFLRIVVGGLGTIYRPIWLYDAFIKIDRMKQNLLGVNLYFTRAIAWIVTAYSIINQVEGNLPYELIWVGWVIIGTSFFHRYQAGSSASHWLSFLISSTIVFIFQGYFQNYPSHTPHSIWWEAFQVTLWVLIIYLVLFFIMEHSTIVRSLLSPFYFRNSITTFKDLCRYKKDIEDKGIFKKYLPVASVAVMQIKCSNELWRGVVLCSIENSSVLLVDITNITISSSLSWELTQACNDGIATYFTCEESSLLRSQSVLYSIGYHNHDVFTWKISNQGPYGNFGIAFDDGDLAKRFLKYTDNHVQKRKRHKG